MQKDIEGVRVYLEWLEIYSLSINAVKAAQEMEKYLKSLGESKFKAIQQLLDQSLPGPEAAKRLLEQLEVREWKQRERKN